MPFFMDQELKRSRLDDKAVRVIRARGGNMMATEIFFEPGAIGALHTHEHEQIVYIAEGELDFTSDGETRRVKAGDSLYVPGGVEHGCVAVTKSRVVDIFTPQRHDFLAGD